jgi:hypothetical protein
MTALQARSTRVAWTWCLIYTAALPRAERLRRREEIRCHLWESEHVGLRPAAVLRACLRGIADDVSWAVGLGARRLGRALLTPTPYFVLAAVLVLQGAFYWGSRTGRAHSFGTGISELAAVACLLAAGATYYARRRS